MQVITLAQILLYSLMYRPLSLQYIDIVELECSPAGALGSPNLSDRVNQWQVQWYSTAVTIMEGHRVRALRGSLGLMHWQGGGGVTIS
jgi:hypothetical protein